MGDSFISQFDIFQKKIMTNSTTGTADNIDDNNKQNKERWLKIKFKVPDKNFGQNSTPCGQSSDINTSYGNVLANNTYNRYFIVAKFEKNNNQKVNGTDKTQNDIWNYIIKSIKNQGNEIPNTNKILAFDNHGNLGLISTTFSRNEDEPITSSQGSTIFINPLQSKYKKCYQQVPYLFDSGSATRTKIPNIINPNGKFIFNNSATYFLYNDAEITSNNNFDPSQGNFYLLYNPIHRSLFSNIYDKNPNKQKSTFNYIFRDYCYSLATPGTNSNENVPINGLKDDNLEYSDYFSDPTCNCYAFPSIYCSSPNNCTNSKVNQSGLTPLVLSTLSGKNRASWKSKVTASIPKNYICGTTNMAQSSSSSDNQVSVCLNSQFCYAPNKNSFVNKFIDEQPCDNFSIIQNFCSETINNADVAKDNTFINQCGSPSSSGQASGCYDDTLLNKCGKCKGMIEDPTTPGKCISAPCKIYNKNGICCKSNQGLDSNNECITCKADEILKEDRDGKWKCTKCSNNSIYDYETNSCKPCKKDEISSGNQCISCSSNDNSYIDSSSTVSKCIHCDLESSPGIVNQSKTGCDICTNGENPQKINDVWQCTTKERPKCKNNWENPANNCKPFCNTPQYYNTETKSCTTCNLGQTVINNQCIDCNINSKIVNGECIKCSNPNFIRDVNNPINCVDPRETFPQYGYCDYYSDTLDSKKNIILGKTKYNGEMKLTTDPYKYPDSTTEITNKDERDNAIRQCRNLKDKFVKFYYCDCSSASVISDTDIKNVPKNIKLYNTEDEVKNICTANKCASQINPNKPNNSNNFNILIIIIPIVIILIIIIVVFVVWLIKNKKIKN